MARLDVRKALADCPVFDIDTLLSVTPNLVESSNRIASCYPAARVSININPRVVAVRVAGLSNLFTEQSSER
jgi:hypothetical protein